MTTTQELADEILRWLGAGAIDRMDYKDRLRLQDIVIPHSSHGAKDNRGWSPASPPANPKPMPECCARALELEAMLPNAIRIAGENLDNMTRLENAEAELVALKVAAEEFLGWQNGVPLLNYDPPYQDAGRGYTASLNRLDELLKEKST